MDWTLPLRWLQNDFIERLNAGNLFHCRTRGRHSEVTDVYKKKTEEIRKFSWEMVEKYRKSDIPSQQIFINNVKGKLAEEAFKARIEHIDRANLPWFVLQRGLFRPSGTGMTAFRPDVAVIDRTELVKEPLWSEQSILTRGSSIKLIAEVVSGNWQNDYARKLEDYAAVGICEYWIVDYAGLGGIRYIGKPKQPTLSICTLVDGEYEIELLRGQQAIASMTLPELNLTAEQVLKAPHRE